MSKITSMPVKSSNYVTEYIYGLSVDSMFYETNKYLADNPTGLHPVSISYFFNGVQYISVITFDINTQEQYFYSCIKDIITDTIELIYLKR